MHIFDVLGKRAAQQKSRTFFAGAMRKTAGLSHGKKRQG